jgi:two-component system, cell cycle sensor histidine kinase and response regulator CckA
MTRIIMVFVHMDGSPSPGTGINPPERARVVIVVDDDEANLRLMASILELNGFQVHRMPSGHAAFAWIQANPIAFDLLVTDVRMPEMSGLELAGLVLKTRPGARILFVTGYSDFSPSELVASGDPRDHILQKPFGPVALIQKVQALLKP